MDVWKVTVPPGAGLHRALRLIGRKNERRAMLQRAAMEAFDGECRPELARILPDIAKDNAIA